MGSFADQEPSISEADLEVNQGFQCMLKNDNKTDDTNPNAKAMSILQQMAGAYDRMGDRWRTLSYRCVFPSKMFQEIAVLRTVSSISGARHEDYGELPATLRLGQTLVRR